ncbi:hypothetical protein AX768_23785 [Burkholderia sp. PAMC 28687]|uniref:hypothetical protein n=1 Tax=Burkholderia sp. PAMC 28687 TaxID=1795874 RepID=UPI0007812A36|nr:hypothetical protein [Burkholderia sp. PAMC 28687]AMM17258.1 hypothetical protein AX768_23785 [Burkholderia sp. PAMC 28687]
MNDTNTNRLPLRDNETSAVLYFSPQGYARVRNMGFLHKRSMCNMARLLVATILREEQPKFKDAEYSAFDMTWKLPITLETKSLNRLIARAENRGVPVECLGEFISNYTVQS